MSSAARVLLLSIVSCVSLSCSAQSVNVTKTPPVLEEVIDVALSKGQGAQDDVHQPEGKIDYDPSARTEWFFGCRPDFDYDIVGQERQESRTKVRLRVRRVEMAISLAIKTTRAKNASPVVLSHESGHAEICQYVYGGAEAIARNAAQKIVGEEFEGSGVDDVSARQAALDAAGEKLCSEYRELTATRTNDISNSYDGICRAAPKVLPAQAVKQAIAQNQNR